jgi:hypothetical protein
VKWPQRKPSQHCGRPTQREQRVCAPCARNRGERASVPGAFDWASPKGWLIAYGRPKPVAGAREASRQ